MAELQILQYSDVKAFLARAEPWLSRREAFFNVVLGVANMLLLGRRYGEQDPVALTLEEEGQVCGAMLWTPPHAASIAAEDPRVATRICEWLSNAEPPVVAINIPSEYKDQIGLHFSRRIKEELHVQVYELRDLQKSPRLLATPGHSRTATPADLDVLVAWLQAFEKELKLHDGLSRYAQRWIDDQGVELWIDSEKQPVAMAVCNRQLPRGSSVGPVYTPPDARGHGYAAAVTAAVSEKILASGKEYCCLFADTQNPSTNRMYQRLGYRSLGEWLNLKFEMADETHKNAP